MAVFLFVLSVAMGTASGVGYKRGASVAERRFDLPLLLVGEPACLTLFFFVASCFEGLRADAGLVLPALLSGLSTFGAMFCLFRSMKEGSFAVTVVLANMSFVIPIFLSWCVLGEDVSLWQLAGIVLMIAVIALVNAGHRPKRKSAAEDGTNAVEVARETVDEGAAAPSSRRWILWALGACLGNGLLNFGIKLQQYYLPGEGQCCFNCFNFLFCTLAALAYLILVRARSGPADGLSRKLWQPLLILAVSCGVNFYVQTLLPGYVNAAVQFTVCIGGSTILGMLIGWLYYREPFRWQSAVTLAASCAAIVLQIL